MKLKMKLIVCYIFLALLCVHVARSVENFGNEFYCGGSKQSPIDLRTKNLIRTPLPYLKFSKVYDERPTKMLATGGGSLTIGIEYLKHVVPTIWGGPLSMRYKLSQFHFHWAQRDDIGSEHLVNGMSYIMELHAVHIKENLTFPEASLDMDDGIAVIGYFFEYTERDNYALNHLINAFANVSANKSSPTDIPLKFPLNALIRPVSCNYVTYKGSLTTPPCSENVRWIISPYVNTISRQQMAKFRELAANGSVTKDNYRNLQKINNRKIFYAMRKESSHDYVHYDPLGNNYNIENDDDDDDEESDFYHLEGEGEHYDED